MATVTTAASNILRYEQDRLLLGFYNQLMGDQLAQKSQNIPANRGDTTYWHRKIKLARNITPLGAGVDATPKSIYMTSINAEAIEYGDAVSRERIVELTSKHLGTWDEMVDSCSIQAAESMDYLIMTLLAANAYRMRADNDATYQVDVTATGDGLADFTTFVSTSLTQADNFWNGGYITITMPETTTYLDRKNYCETRLITGFTGGTVTHAAFLAVTKQYCTAHLCVATGIVATDVLSTGVFGRAVRQLKRNKAIRFNDNVIKRGALSHKEVHNLPPGAGGPGYWACIVNTDTEYDFMQDTLWTDVGKYQDQERLAKGEVGKWMATKVFGTTQPWRETVVGGEAETTGAVHPVHFLGQDAYGISSVAAPAAEPPFGLLLNLMTSKDLGEYIPRNSSAGWIAYYACRSLNSLWNVAMLCGATA